jgi:hypothetical protein
MFDFSTLNYSAILVSGLVSFMSGALWYSPLLFSKTWQKEVGLSDKTLENCNIAFILIGTLVLMILMNFGLAISLQEYSLNNDITWQTGVVKGLFFGSFFVLTSLGINMLYLRKSVRLFLIDGGYQLMFLILSGIILAVWR